MPKWFNYIFPSAITGYALYKFYINSPAVSGSYYVQVTCMDIYEFKVNQTFLITVTNSVPYALKTIGTQYVQVD